MRYDHICAGTFIERPNRFVAIVEIDGARERVHVKNTGRCQELLEHGNRVYLEASENPARKTRRDLVAVERRDGRLINMDSMAANVAAEEWLACGGLGEIEDLRAEVRMGDSRFDFCGMQGGRRLVVEVKGCTLESGGVARFPDAPTLRGVKHVRELAQLSREGCRCVLLIVIQMKGARRFRPNWETHAEFGDALIAAQAAGVEIRAVDCLVQPNEITIDAPVEVNLTRPREFAW